MAEVRGRPIGSGLVDPTGRPLRSEPASADELTQIKEEGSRFHVYSQLASIQYKVNWTKPEVDDAIRQHELGYFAGSALLADTMTRDDTVDAVLDAQVLGLLGLDRIVEPSKKGNLRANKKVASIFRERFLEFFPRDVLAPIAKWAILMGFAIAQKIWRPNADGTEWVPELEWWHPAFTYVQIDTQQFFVITTEGVVEVTPDSKQWLLYTPGGKRYAWMNGAIRSIAVPWLARQYTWRDWLRCDELWALGVRKAIVPAKADEKSKKKFYGQVANMGSDATALCPQGEDGNKYDVDVLFPEGANTGEGFDKLMSKAEAKIAIRINGQTLSTEVKGASLAAAKVHENVKQDILQARGNSLGECLAEQVAGDYIEFHDFPANTNVPELGWNVDPPIDTSQKADTAQKAAIALKTLKVDANAPVSEKAFMQQFDLPVLEAGETNQAAPTPASPGGAPASSPGSPTGDPKDAALLVALAAMVPARARDYVDDVAGAATAAGQRALKRDVDSIRDAIEGCTSLEDARHRVREAFRRMDPTQLARIAQAGMAMAGAAGLHAVHQEHR